MRSRKMGGRDRMKSDYIKNLAISMSTAFAALGPPLMLTTTLSVIAGYGEDEGFALALKFLRAAATMAVWWVCAIVTVANSGSPATAVHLVLLSAAASIFCAIGALVSVFFAADLVSSLATSLVMTLPTLALAVMNARLVKRRMDLG